MRRHLNSPVALVADFFSAWSRQCRRQAGGVLNPGAIHADASKISLSFRVKALEDNLATRARLAELLLPEGGAEGNWELTWHSEAGYLREIVLGGKMRLERQRSAVKGGRGQ